MLWIATIKIDLWHMPMVIWTPSEWSAIEQGWNNPPMVDNPESYKKLTLYMAFMNTIPGLPVIYYGSEFGMSGASDPDNRRMMRFDDDLTRKRKINSF